LPKPLFNSISFSCNRFFTLAKTPFMDFLARTAIALTPLYAPEKYSRDLPKKTLHPPIRKGINSIFVDPQVKKEHRQTLTEP